MNYYTPAIEDLHVGYECEILKEEGVTQVYFNGVNGWNKQIIKFEQIHILPAYISKEEIRTPYLTNEQIEAEGWEKHPEIWIDPGQVYRKGEYTFYNSINKIFKKDIHTIYEGKCPSINEFRKICKLLGI